MATILIVDDLAANREVLVTLLRYAGHRLIEAEDGSRALAAVQVERPDLIITDVLMPVMDGYEFVRQLRLNPATNAIPVVFTTAHYGEREARALALSTGVSYVLTKPAEPDEILRVVSAALTAGATAAPPPSSDFDREHMRLLTDKLSEKVEDLRLTNARLRALVNIGLELASERDSARLLLNVCTSARELFNAAFVTLGIVDRDTLSVRYVVSCGPVPPDWITAGETVPGILQAVVGERQTLRATNAGGDSSRLGFPPRHPAVPNYIATAIASPGHVYGWLCLVGTEGRPFVGEDEQLAIALSGQVGRIYENGHFYRIAQKRAEQLEHEILERQHGEDALRRERDRAQRYLDTAEVILLALDIEGHITLVNRYACSILGWSREELMGRDWVSMCLPARVQEASRDKFDHLIHGDVSLVEHPVITRSGEERLIEWRNMLLRDEHRTVIGTFSCGTDITERTQAVEALRKAEERMRFALQSADVGIWDMDYTTGELRWSERLEAQYGVKPGSFAGTFDAFVERIHPDDRKSVVATIEQAMKDGRDFSTHMRSVAPDGTVRWLSGAGKILLDDRGRPVRGLGISMDVTERRTLEAQYQQAQKMEAVGRLAGGVAHDFNNLLTAILGYCELLKTDFDPADPRQADLEEIQKAGTSAASLTRQLLAFSRKQIIEPALIDLNAVMTSMQSMIRRLIGEDVKVVMALEPNLSRVMADRGQIEQIMLNLAVNARDAMPKGGALTIQTENVELDENYERTHFSVKPGSYVSFTVTDTGTGMTPDVQERLFEPFFTTKEAGKGTGLGLATVHGIVAGSGGTITVYSEPGKGTAFTIYLPRAEATETVAPSQPAASPAPVDGHTVLVVDDAQGLRELARRFLQRMGYSVHVAGSPEEAIQMFEANPAINLLLTDVVMPRISGPELVGRLVQQRPTLKVVYMSGYTAEAMVQHGVLNQATALLHKPFTSETLALKLREVLDR